MMDSLRIGGTLACLALFGAGACSDDGRVIGERAPSGGTSGLAGSGSSGSSGSASGGSSARGGTSPTGGSSGDGSGGMASNAGTANAGTENAGTAGDATGGDAGGGAGGSGESATGGASGTAGDTGNAGNGGAGGSAGSGGGSGGMSGSSGMNCVDRTCSASEACVAYRTIGGAITFPGDGGACPLYAHLEGSTCQANFAYQCVAQPRCTGGVIDCTCGTCPQGNPTCRAPTASQWLDPSAKLVCELLAP